MSDSGAAGSAPAIRPFLFSAIFVSDLRALHNKLPPAEPKDCLILLAQRFDDRMQRIRGRMRLLSRDVQIVFAHVDSNPTKHFNVLARRFAGWRQNTANVLRILIAALPADDPLRSDISLFGTMDCGRLERAHTKTLAWLLHPRKEHRFGMVLLNKLLQHAEGTSEHPAVEVDNLVAEQPADEKRIDVYAEGRRRDENGVYSKWCLVIEAKIDAQEGQNQLAHYDDWLERQGTPSIARLFLTPDSRKAESTGPAAASQWRSLSFLELNDRAGFSCTVFA